MNDELIDRAIALLQSAKEPKEPREWWGGMDSSGDIMRSTITGSREETRRAMQKDRWGPHTLVHIREVLP